MNSDQFDVIVVGAGAMGSAAAYHLARDRQRVLVLEQFEIGHTRGSSHGESRIFRYAYPSPAYVRLAIQARRLWSELEADASEKLLLETGGLDFAEEPGGQAQVTAIAASLASEGCTYEHLDYASLARRFPQWRMSEETEAVYSPDAGILNPTRCVQVMLARAAAYGAEIHEREPVRQLHPEGSGVVVETGAGQYRARNAVIAAGAWSGALLREIGFEAPLRISQEQTVYFRPRSDPRAFMVGRFPIWIHHREQVVYGFPIVDAPGIKVAFHGSGLYVNVEEYTQTPRQEVTDRLQAYLERYLPEAAGDAFDPTTCLYTNTPDEDFIVDTAPNLPQVTIAAGFSGHGFKFAIAIGRAVADLIEQGGTELEIGHFGLDRFRGA